MLSFGGHAAAFRSTFWRFPDRRFSVVLLSNDEHFQQLNKAEAIIGLYLKDDLKPLPQQPQTANSPVAANQNKTVEKSNADLRDFAGRFYSDELETFYTATAANGRLLLTHLRHGNIELTEAAGKDKFSGRIGFPVEVEFTRDKAGAVTGFKISNWGAKNVRFDKVK